MPELNKEQFEELPEFIKAQYVPDDDGYSHKGMLKVKQTANDLDSKLKDLNTKLETFEDAKKAEIEKARTEALEQARSKGDVKAIEERYQQQMEDLAKRLEDTENEYKSRLEKLTTTVKAEKKNAIISELSEMATDKGKKAFKALVKSRVDVDAETGKAIFLDDDGRATSLDLKGFMAEIKKDDAFAPLIMADVTTNGAGKVKTGNDWGRASGKPELSDKEARRQHFREKFNLDE